MYLTSTQCGEAGGMLSSSKGRLIFRSLIRCWRHHSEIEEEPSHEGDAASLVALNSARSGVNCQPFRLLPPLPPGGCSSVSS